MLEERASDRGGHVARRVEAVRGPSRERTPRDRRQRGRYRVVARWDGQSVARWDGQSGARWDGQSVARWDGQSVARWDGQSV
ncbi:MAG: hypothetical protein FJ096_12485, partial [Deltaproteobacteria bacterium]|nr:hypothetical protein [Deltaproteobacteria bacterium]